jgi:hypothetical protein
VNLGRVACVTLSADGVVGAVPPEDDDELVVPPSGGVARLEDDVELVVLDDLFLSEESQKRTMSPTNTTKLTKTIAISMARTVTIASFAAPTYNA